MPQEKEFAGQRWTLRHETRWTRIYKSVDGKSSYDESRFIDGSASISLDELKTNWASWNEGEQLDFSLSISHLKSPELPDIVRFLAHNAHPSVISNIANVIPGALPAEEAADLLLKLCAESPPGEGGNFFQALSKTPYEGKVSVLKNRLVRLLNEAGCWEKGDKFFNDIANEVVYRIRDLITLGEPEQDFRELYLRLKQHPHEFTRTITRNYLDKLFQA